MSRPAKSQWDFGELFPPEETRRVLSVSELTTQIKRLLEQQVGQVWVSGEISNLRAQSSGHSYFTLKDGAAQLGCVLFRGTTVAASVRAALQDGQKVILHGDVTVYEARGQYQLIVRAIELQGVGALQFAFEKLKQKLAAQGWFAPERKRPLPRFPWRIGVVTSPTGAALRDVLHVIQRRDPSLEVILAPCRVQGEGAAAEIAAAMRLLNAWTLNNAEEGKGRKGEEELVEAAPGHAPYPWQLDLILVTRGGGSLEDLWAFNEEIVAQAIYESALPVVSAVGHEIDFTISDFVADVRAATPSAAAEIITEGVYASREFVAEAPALLTRLVEQQLEARQETLAGILGRLTRAHPRRRMGEWAQRLDDAHADLLRSARQSVGAHGVSCQNLTDRLRRVRPALLVREQRELLRQEARRLREAGRHVLRGWRDRFAALDARLRLLGPEQVLARGYSITTDAATGAVMREASRVQPGQRLKTRLHIGEVRSVAEE